MLVIAAALSCALIALCFALWGRMPTGLRPPLLVFNVFYILTSVIGATLIADDTVRSLWMLMFPTMDARWLDPGGDWLYWLIVLGPLAVTNAVAWALARPLGAAVARLAGRVTLDPQLLPCALVGLAGVSYCMLNLAQHGYLGAGLFNADLVGSYQANIQLRSEMVAVLGATHYGLVYMAIPAVCIVALYKASTTRQFGWWALFVGLCAALTYLYLSTLTKGNLIVFGLAICLAAYLQRLVGTGGLIAAGVAGIASLVVLEALLSGGSMFDFTWTVANVIFRESSEIPFYLAVFPAQHPFVGLDLGLGWLGWGVDAPPNLIVANVMFPSTTWVQGAAPAAAHVVAYSQAGASWSLVTMGLVGLLIAAASGLARTRSNALLHSAFIGCCIACYYMTQTDAVGVFLHSYGLKWWLLALVAVAAVQHGLAAAIRGASRDAPQTTPSGRTNGD